MKEMQKEKLKIGGLAKELGIEKFVVRFWEKEFGIAASRTKGGQRFYKKKDFDQFKKIKKLLYEEGFTIAGAKKLLADNKQAPLIEQNNLLINSTPIEMSLKKTMSHKSIIEQLRIIQTQLSIIKNKLNHIV